MEIKGQISEIIYQNEVNSYTIAEFETDEELATIVGYLPFINKGDSLKLVGNFVNHPDYGRQFKIQTFEKIMPETLEALERATQIYPLTQSSPMTPSGTCNVGVSPLYTICWSGFTSIPANFPVPPIMATFGFLDTTVKALPIVALSPAT